MGSNNARLLFALLIGLSIGYLAGFLTAVRIEPVAGGMIQATPPDGSGGASPQAANSGVLPEGHPKIDFQKEIDALEPILKNNPKDFAALSQMGNLYYDMGRHNEAVSYYERALAVRPDDIGVRTDMGTSLHYVGQNQRAVKEFEAVLARNSSFPQALHNLGVVKAGLGDNKGAIQAWENLLATNPDYPAASQVRENIAKLKAGKPL
jgi:tetratricopeptide (TPR) repeat protein